MLKYKLFLAYFKNDDQALFLAEKKSHWESFDRIPLSPMLRDPFITKKDGYWHLFFTESWSSNKFGHSISKNLRDWQTPNYLTIPDARYCWAPEIIENMIFWSSNESIWAAYDTLLEPFVLFNPGYHVIDATIRKTDKWEMAFKDERDEFKAIRIAYSDKLEGPYKDISNPLTPKNSEGPIFYKNNLIFDFYGENRWGALSFNDYSLKSFDVPSGARHGSIFLLS